MLSPSSIFGVVAFALACLTSPAAAEDKIMPLPWDGRAFDLTTETITEKYLTHILTNRDGHEGKVSDYVSVEKEGRKPPYNKDTGVINIAIDPTAISEKQTRSELAQVVETNEEGTTFFRVSMMKKEPFLNLAPLQIISTKLNTFRFCVDASYAVPQFYYLNNNSNEPKWTDSYQVGIWYNFMFAVSAQRTGTGAHVDFYMSTGDAELALMRSDDVETPFSPSEELFIGLSISPFSNRTEFVVNPKQDIMSFNGVSVEASLTTN